MSSAGGDRARETTGYRDHHATIFVPPAVSGPIEAVRREWDPVMAAHIAAHVTLVYPPEAPIVELLVERIRSSSRRVRPFRLRMGTISRAGDGAVSVDVEDVEGEYRALRDDVLRPPFCSLAFGPHVTLIHPRTSSRGPAFWSSGWRQLPVREFTTREIAITAREGARWVVLERFPVGQRGDAARRGAR